MTTDGNLLATHESELKPVIWFAPELRKRIFDIIKRAANSSCCLCRDDCLSCDAQDLLKELWIDKNS